MIILLLGGQFTETICHSEWNVCGMKNPFLRALFLEILRFVQNDNKVF